MSIASKNERLQRELSETMNERLHRLMREALESHPKARLIKEIQKNNVKGYSKMSKPELIDLMMNERNKSKFRYIKHAKLEKAEAAQVAESDAKRQSKKVKKKKK